MLQQNVQRGVRIVGAGAFVPSLAVDNHRIAEAIPGWPAERIEEKTSIRERRFLWDFDERTGRAVPPPEGSDQPRSNADMCEIALRRALDKAGLDAKELDAVFLVTCTPDRLNFNHDAMEVHRRLGCRSDAYALVIDDGCGGTPYVMDMAYKMIKSGAVRTVAVIGSAFSSPQLNREVFTSWVEPAPGRKPINAYFSMYVFGDGAGAVVLRGGGLPGEGILSSMSGNDYMDLVHRRAGGFLQLPYQGETHPGDHAFVVDGQLVARTYPLYMQRCLDEVLSECPELKGQVARYYFHQPNKRLMDRFIQSAALPAERVAYNVDRYGNTSAAGMLILLAEDLDAGVVRLGGGDLVLIAAVGANVHYGAQLVRL
ncbi:MAG TPA: 3-oxoacyl-[acyl-carrier-protein] synthase III C-terminal domain-containing protein [Thermoanaerobaculia bacterium]|nr:3-oxoacyl-[acyl-carrier-protein] synthase III C-terminal domain-containing protein [Thermoanaerobaculia bacterium]